MAKPNEIEWQYNRMTNNRMAIPNEIEWQNNRMAIQANGKAP